MEGELESERERYEKINIELQNTYRKMEEIGANAGLDYDGRDREKYFSKRTGDLYPVGTSQQA